jgi:hypothetical protein
LHVLHLFFTIIGLVRIIKMGDIILPLDSLAELLSWTTPDSGGTPVGRRASSGPDCGDDPIGRAGSASDGGGVPIGRASRRSCRYLDGKEWRSNGSSWQWLLANPLRDIYHFLMIFQRQNFFIIK